MPQCAVGDDLDTAVKVLFEAISPPGRLWNPYAAQMARSEFKNRIQKAALGHLKPVDEVKPVDEKNPPPLYEIRWQGIPVTNRLADNSIAYSTVIVRMYHSEPASAPEHFIGHHAHEKEVSIADVNAAQQVEINVAKSMYKLGEVVNWGIAS